MPDFKRIALIGYMGAGKTTIGKALARKLNLELFDLDFYIEERFRMKIPQIFAQSGEARFREMERNKLHEVAEFENVIISCGGGTPCFFDNMDYLNTKAETVFLNAQPKVLCAHLQMGKTQRPLVQGKTGEELEKFVTESLAAREPFYRKAKHVVDVEIIEHKYQIDELVDRIIRLTES